tara:strand:+ start:45 stop:263 length:219 start_codon:yes stop_codon:yes gene_type:complete
MTEDEITVKVQRMFPNCDKYKKCCVDSGMEETMEKVKQIANYDEMIKDILEKAKIEGIVKDIEEAFGDKHET